jgi:hypothetical protein
MGILKSANFRIKMATFIPRATLSDDPELTRLIAAGEIAYNVWRFNINYRRGDAGWREFKRISYNVLLHESQLENACIAGKFDRTGITPKQLWINLKSEGLGKQSNIL